MKSKLQLTKLGPLQAPVVKPPKFPANDYEQIRPLSKGSYGMTFLMNYRKTGEPVVVKIMYKKKSPPFFKTDLEDALVEANAMQRMHDICTDSTVPCLYNLYQDNTRFFLVEQLLGGAWIELHLFIRNVTNGTHYRCNKPTLIAQNLIDAVRTMHSYGVTSRDIKPTNTFVNTEDCRVRIIDFGFACLADEPKDTGVASQVQKEPKSHKSTGGGANVATHHRLTGKNVDETDFAQWRLDWESRHKQPLTCSPCRTLSAAECKTDEYSGICYSRKGSAGSCAILPRVGKLLHLESKDCRSKQLSVATLRESDTSNSATASTIQNGNARKLQIATPEQRREGYISGVCGPTCFDFMGTPGFRPPEGLENSELCFYGLEANKKFDVWQTGMTIAELLLRENFIGRLALDVLGNEDYDPSDVKVVTKAEQDLLSTPAPLPLKNYFKGKVLKGMQAMLDKNPHTRHLPAFVL